MTFSWGASRGFIAHVLDTKRICKPYGTCLIYIKVMTQVQSSRHNVNIFSVFINIQIRRNFVERQQWIDASHKRTRFLCLRWQLEASCLTRVFLFLPYSSTLMLTQLMQVISNFVNKWRDGYVIPNVCWLGMPIPGNKIRKQRLLSEWDVFVKQRKATNISAASFIRQRKSHQNGDVNRIISVTVLGLSCVQM